MAWELFNQLHLPLAVLLGGLCLISGRMAVGLVRFLPAGILFGASGLLGALAPRSAALRLKQVWLAWLIVLLLWLILAGLVRQALLGLKFEVSLTRPRLFSLASLFSGSAVPYRAYPLSCCLLQ